MNQSFVRYKRGKRKRRKACPALPSSVEPIAKMWKEASPTLSATGGPPKRQYYHSRSRLPMQPGGWVVDSDDESTGEWLDDLAQAVRIASRGILVLLITLPPLGLTQSTLAPQ